MTLDITRDLGDGLVLRRTMLADTDALVTLQSLAFANPDTGEPEQYLGGWTRDLMKGKHPPFGPDDFFAVENTKTGELVSSLCLISQVWTMEGIPFGVGRPEIVGTLPDWRNRGLVRALFQAIHQISAERGEPVQAITGIPYYYRQFGYEYALDLDHVRATHIPQHIPELKVGEVEKFRLRIAEPDDLEFIAELDKRGAERSLLHCERDLARIKSEHFQEFDAKNGTTSWWNLIETAEGERAGILYHRRYIYRGRNKVNAFEIIPKFSWSEVVPSVLRALVRMGETIENEDGKPFSKILWFLPPNHPLFTVAGDSTAPDFEGYAWYMRVADLPAFLNHIKPLLEQRLAASQDLQKYTGTLHLNFFKSGLALNFEHGSIKNIAPWRPRGFEPGHNGFGDATFPDLTFLKLLFGYRSRAELQAMFPDCIVSSRESAALLDVLFPKKLSYVIPLS